MEHLVIQGLSKAYSEMGSKKIRYIQVLNFFWIIAYKLELNT